MVVARDRSCRVMAHLVPPEKGTWFLHNNMAQYSSAVAVSPVGRAVNDALNALLLRSVMR